MTFEIVRFFRLHCNYLNANFKIMKELKKELTTRHLLVILITSFFITSCNSDTEDFLEDSQTSLNESTLLDVRNDLSTFNFENFVLQNNSFKLQINDTLSLDFEDVEHPTIYDPEEDIVYSTKDNKGSIAFANGDMYFIYDSDEGTFYGGLHNQAQEALTYRNKIKEEELNLINRGEKNNGRKLLTLEGKHNVIEFSPYVFSTEAPSENQLSQRSKKSFCGTKDDIFSENLEKTEENKSKRLSSKGNKRINVYVYTYEKAISDRDINFSMIIARESLKSVYRGNSATFNSKVSTYFGASRNGRRIVNFERGSDSGEFLINWEDYGGDNFNASISGNLNRKYLLLTDFNFGTTLGSSRAPSSFGWAHKSRLSHSVAGHELGHMFGAKHTSKRFDSGLLWWKIDVMFSGDPGLWYKRYKEHFLFRNRITIQRHISDNTN